MGSQYLRRVVEGLKAMAEESPASLTLADQDGSAHERFPIPPLALGCCLMVLRCTRSEDGQSAFSGELATLSWRALGFTPMFQVQMFCPPSFLRIPSACMGIFPWVSAEGIRGLLHHTLKVFLAGQYCRCPSQSRCWCSAGDKSCAAPW